MNRRKLPSGAAALAGLLFGCAAGCTAAFADQFNTTQGGSPSAGTVLQRRQGTSGNAAVPVDESNPLPFAAAAGAYANGGVALSTSPVQIFAANTTRVRLVLLNNSGIGTAGGAAIVEWCRWGTVGAAPAAAGGVGSFALQPNGGGRDDNGAGVNPSALNCVAESGTPLLYAEQY